MARVLEPKRGEVYLFRFDPAFGAEIKKTRPALIVQNDVANEYGAMTIIAAISAFDGGKLYPTEVRVRSMEGCLDKDSIVVLNQLRSIDKRRLGKKLGTLNADTMQTVDLGLKNSLGLR